MPTGGDPWAYLAETAMPVKHVVLFRVKPGTPPAKVHEVFADLAVLIKKIPGLLDCSSGANASLEGLAKGFTHGFVMTFQDEASRDGYLPHPEHEKAKQKLLGLIDGGVDGVIVLDWKC